MACVAISVINLFAFFVSFVVNIKAYRDMLR